MMLQTIDPERAVLAAGIMVLAGIVIFLNRNKKQLISRLRGGHE